MNEDWINEAIEEYREFMRRGMSPEAPEQAIRELLLDAYERGYQDGRRSRYFDGD